MLQKFSINPIFVLDFEEEKKNRKCFSWMLCFWRMLDAGHTEES